MTVLDCEANRRVLIIDDNPAIHEDFRTAILIVVRYRSGER
jgi:hypothetical protein